MGGDRSQEARVRGKWQKGANKVSVDKPVAPMDSWGSERQWGPPSELHPQGEEAEAFIHQLPSLIGEEVSWTTNTLACLAC